MKEIKITIEKQIPFATSSNLELFKCNRNLSIANKNFKDTVACLDMALQEKDQQIQEKDQEIQKRDQEIEQLQVSNKVRNFSASKYHVKAGINIIANFNKY